MIYTTFYTESVRLDRKSNTFYINKKAILHKYMQYGFFIFINIYPAPLHFIHLYIGSD